MANTNRAAISWGKPKPEQKSESLGNYGGVLGGGGFNQGGIYGQPGGGYNPTQATNTPTTTTPTQNAGVAGGATAGANDIYNSADANYIRNLPTAYTPEQQLLMKNATTNAAAAGQRGTNDRIREAMAAQGTGGGGAEIGALTNSMIGGNQALGQSLSGIDIANANAGLQGGLAKGGLLNSLMGVGMDQNKLGENARQFDTGQYNDLYKWGNETDYQRKLDRQNSNDYNSQLQKLLQMLGLA